MKTDIQIAQEAVLEPISDVAASLGLDGESLIPYGKYKAKVDHRLVKKLAEKKDAKVILVTAISPTPAGEGKTTTSVGLADALHRMGKNVVPRAAGAQPRPRVRRKGRRRRRRVCTGGAHGGHQPALHRRSSRHRRGQQSAGRHD